jgi:cysteine desulfurase
VPLDSIYMDHHATTPCDPRVVEAMFPYFSKEFGNAASRNHAFGWRAEEAVELARERIAALIGALPKEIVFTSGATESDNLMLAGILRLGSAGDHLVTVVTEHPAVLDSAKALEEEGFSVTRLPVASNGLIEPARVAEAITERTRLVAVMWANNEIGVLQPIAEIAAICRERGVRFATDAAQAVGKVAVDVKSAGVDLLAFTAHKMYGPKGVGALYVRSGAPRLRLAAQMHGGGHERELRSGTLNVPGIVGFGTACEIASRERNAEAERLLALRESLRAGIFARVEGVHVNGDLQRRLPGNLNLSFDGVEGEALLMSLRDVALSSGSACASASAEPSHVIRALGVSDERAHASLRFGLGRGNTIDQVEAVIEKVANSVARLRAMGAPAMWRAAQ